jgi:hypothetical protein
LRSTTEAVKRAVTDRSMAIDFPAAMAAEDLQS